MDSSPRPILDSKGLRPETRLVHAGISRTPFGENAVGRFSGWKGSFREVSAYSTAYPELAQGAACCWRPGRPLRHHLKKKLDRVPR